MIKELRKLHKLYKSRKLPKTIFVKLYNNQTLPTIIKEGDWIDIAITSEVQLQGPTADTLKQVNKEKVREVNFFPQKISLDIAMELPKGFEAVVLPRSSTFSKYGITLANSEGVIDNSYNGDGDIWGATILPFRTTTVPKGTRLFQFRIQLSQKATFIQKIKWLFWDGKIVFISVPNLGNKNRGGFGKGTEYLDHGTN